MAKEQFTNGYALLIAVNDNLVSNYALPTVAKDAAALQEVLIHPERCAYPKENVRLLKGSDASRNGIRQGLSWLKERIAADRSGNATAVIYYSGHGVLNSADKSYHLLPYDTRYPITDSLLPATEIADEIEMVRPRRLLVIFDCCHAGGMGVKGGDLFAGQGLAKAAAPAEARSVVALTQGQGRAVLSSSTADESSYVRPDRKMSIFTYHLVEGLTGYARQDGEPYILVSDLMSYVSRKVPQTARDEYNVPQTPVYEFSGENFPVAMALGGEGARKGQPLPDPLVPPGGTTINTGGGGYVAGNVTAGGDVHLGATTIHGDQVKGGKYVLSGDFRGAMLNIESQLANVTQTILDAPVGDAAGRANLTGLIAGLQAEINQLPAGRAKEAGLLATRLSMVSKALAAGDGELALVGGSTLERAADGLGDVRPSIPAIARQITAALHRLTGA